MNTFLGQRKSCFWFDLPPLATVSLSTLVRKRSENELRYRVVERLASLLPNSTHLLIRGSQQEEIALNWLLMKSLQVRLRSTESSSPTRHKCPWLDEPGVKCLHG